MVPAGGAGARQRTEMLAAMEAWPESRDNFSVLFQSTNPPSGCRGLYALSVRAQPTLP